MTNTIVHGFIQTIDGDYFPVYASIADSAGAYTYVLIKVVDDANGNAQDLYAYLRNKNIARVCLQATDGSILDAVKIVDNGRILLVEYGGERLADGPNAANIDIWDLNIPVTDATYIYAATTD